MADTICQRREAEGEGEGEGVRKWQRDGSNWRQKYMHTIQIVRKKEKKKESEATV
jgi:hypothetical protein